MPSSPSSAELEGRVVSGHGRHVVVEAGDGRRASSATPAARRAKPSSATGCAGRPSGDEGAVEAVLPRHSLLYRQDAWKTKAFRRQPRPAARRRRGRAGVQRIAAGARPDLGRSGRHPEPDRAQQAGPARPGRRRRHGSRPTRRSASTSIGVALKKEPAPARGTPGAAARQAAPRLVLGPERRRQEHLGQPARFADARVQVGEISQALNTGRRTRPPRPTGTGSTASGRARTDRFAGLPGVRPAPHRAERSRRADARHRPACERLPLLQAAATAHEPGCGVLAALDAGQISRVALPHLPGDPGRADWPEPSQSRASPGGIEPLQRNGN